MDPVMARLHAGNLTNADLAYELDVDATALERFVPDVEHAGAIAGLQAGQGRWHDVPASDGKMLRVRHGYLHGGGLAIDWSATTRATRTAMADHIRHRGGHLHAASPIVITFRVGRSVTQRLPMQSWRAIWKQRGGLEGIFTTMQDPRPQRRCRRSESSQPRAQRASTDDDACRLT